MVAHGSYTHRFSPAIRYVYELSLSAADHLVLSEEQLIHFSKYPRLDVTHTHDPPTPTLSHSQLLQCVITSEHSVLSTRIKH